MTVSLGGLVTSYNSPANNNYDTPTNPLLSFSPAITSTNRVFSIVYEDDTATTTIEEAVSTKTLLGEYSNLHATDGFSIRCFDAFNNIGLDLSSITVDSAGVPSTHDYFVLIHSDDSNMHHFAKITKLVSADQLGDKFEFSPRLGNEIAKDVKFMVFKGPTVSNNILAISCGILADVSKMICARPLFYFYDSKLDKKEELNHNTKYFLRTENISGVSTATSVTLNTGDNTTFITISDYRNRIIDYSKFTYNIKLTDNLREKDDPDTATSNESSVLAGTYTTYTDYNDCFVNARRDANDDVSSLDFTGNKRYIFYNDSPENNNYIPNTYSASIEDTFDAKSGIAEIKLVDITKNLGNKIFNNDRLMAKQKIAEDDLNEWVEVGEIESLFDSATRTYSLASLLPKPNLYFVANMEIKIGNRVCIVDSVSGNVNVVLKEYSRLESEGVFTNTTSLITFSDGDKVYRRRLNPLDSTYYTNSDFDGDKLSRLCGILSTKQYNNYYCNIGSFITNVDETYGLLTIDFQNNLLDSNSSLERAIGAFLLYYEIFYGKIEEINKSLENNQTIFELKGRNTLSKLIDITINKDTLFSHDIIYSSNSPYNDLTTVGTTATWDFDSKTITFSTSVSLAHNTHLWCEFGYIGQVDGATTSSTTATLHDFPYSSTYTAKTVYKENSKLYILNKSLASTNKVNSVTSLTGASDKGFFFRDGYKFTGDFDSLVEGETLVGLSEDNNANATGFNINKIKNIDTDLDFQLEISSFEDDIVNTLIDFTVLEVKENNNIKTVKLAPYMPLTLGREEINPYSEDSAFTTLADIITTGTDPNVLCDASSFSEYNLEIGTPLYIEEEFVGYFIGYNIRNTSPAFLDIYLDRDLSANSNGKSFQISTGKKRRTLHLTNGAHLHGGKIINMVGSSRLPIDYQLLTHHGGISEYKYKEKFGADIIRLDNIEKGKIGKEKIYSLKQDTDTGRLIPYYGTTPILNYYAEFYKGNPESPLGLSLSSKTGTTKNNHYPIEQRGFMPIIGSNYVDRKFVSAIDSNPIIQAITPNKRVAGALDADFISPLELKDKFYQIDSKAARLFLFCNSDRLLYSSTRKDSLMNSDNRTLEGYGLLSLNAPLKTTTSSTKDATIGNTNTITNKDSDYIHSNILSSNKTLSNLKRMGIMRLTDVVYDWAFNQINPEFDVPNDRVIEASQLSYFDNYLVQDSSSTNLTVVNYPSLTTIKMNGTIDNVGVKDVILDLDNNRVIGVVTALSTTDVTNDTLNFNTLYLTDNGALKYGTGDTIRFAKYSEISNKLSVIGRDVEETMLFTLDEGGNTEVNNIHMLKGLLTNQASPTKWENYYIDSGSPSTIPQHFKNLQKGTDYGKNTIILPIAFTQFQSHYLLDSSIDPITESLLTFSDFYSTGGSNTWGVAATSPFTHYQTEFANFFMNLEPSNSGGSSSNDTKIGSLKTVILKEFTTNESGSSSQGTTTPFLTDASLNYVFRYMNLSGSSEPYYGNFITYPSFNTSQTYSTDEDKTVGAYLGFKPHVTFSSVTNNTVKSTNNNTLYYNSLDLIGDNKFLKNIDLTGCYLVPAERGKYYNKNDVTTASESIHKATPYDNEIIYIVSHEYDLTVTTTNPKCYFITDEQLANITYKVMQPNPICFWDNSPTTIRLNTLSSEYTKLMDSNDMYGAFPSFNSGKRTETQDTLSNLEGVQSMYVIVDMDNLSAEGNTIVKTSTGRETILNGINGEYCLSDGETVLITSAKGIDNEDNIGHYLEFGEMQKLDGVVSFSETFELEVNGGISPDAKRALIGTTVSITKEIEETVNELLIENDIDFTLTKENYNIFAAPDFQGGNLFDVINYLLRLKDKKLVNVSGNINIQNYDSTDFISKYTFTDDNITEIKTTKSKFDYFNHVTVYGQSHKAVRKNFREIKANGKKTLEVFQNKLTTQEDVDKEAYRLLVLHTKANTVINIKLAHSEIKTLSVGDVVQLESKASGIERNSYLVLEMSHSYSGAIELKLGQYIKGLEDALSELLISNSQTNSYLRKKEFNENENTFDFFDNFKIKEMHLLIRKREGTGALLGFSTPLNTNTSPFGFGGNITITKLLEEEL